MLAFVIFLIMHQPSSVVHQCMMLAHGMCCLMFVIKFVDLAHAWTFKHDMCELCLKCIVTLSDILNRLRGCCGLLLSL